jgi:hypothetical protein
MLVSMANLKFFMLDECEWTLMCDRIKYCRDTTLFISVNFAKLKLFVYLVYRRGPIPLASPLRRGTLRRILSPPFSRGARGIRVLSARQKTGITFDLKHCRVLAPISRLKTVRGADRTPCNTLHLSYVKLLYKISNCYAR